MPPNNSSLQACQGKKLEKKFKNPCFGKVKLCYGAGYPGFPRKKKKNLKIFSKINEVSITNHTDS